MIHEEVVRRVGSPRPSLGRLLWDAREPRPDVADILLADRGTSIRCQRQPSLQYFLDHPTTVVGPGEDSGTEHGSFEARDAPFPPSLRHRAEDDAGPAGDTRFAISRRADWARFVGKLHIYVQRLQWRRALHFQALEAGVGVALGWAEARGSSPRCTRGILLLGDLLRRVLSELLGRPRSVAGAATIAALCQFAPAGQD